MSSSYRPQPASVVNRRGAELEDTQRGRRAQVLNRECRMKASEVQAGGRPKLSGRGRSFVSRLEAVRRAKQHLRGDGADPLRRCRRERSSGPRRPFRCAAVPIGWYTVVWARQAGDLSWLVDYPAVMDRGIHRFRCTIHSELRPHLLLAKNGKNDSTRGQRRRQRGLAIQFNLLGRIENFIGADRGVRIAGTPRTASPFSLSWLEAAAPGLLVGSPGGKFC